jgi:hypothetical protein
MKTNFRILVGIPMTLVAMSILVGCGGGGVSTDSNSVVTNFAASYKVTMVDAPSGTTNVEFDAISPNGKIIAGTYVEGAGRRVFRYNGAIQSPLTGVSTWSSARFIGNGGVIAATTDTVSAQTGCLIFGNSTTIFDYDAHEVDGWGAGVDDTGAAYRSVQMDDKTFRSFAVTPNGSTPVSVNGGNDLGLTHVSPLGRKLGWVGSQFMAYDPAVATWSEVLAGQTDISPSVILDDGTIAGNQKVGGKWVSFIAKNGTVTNYADSTSTYALLSAGSSGGLFVGSDNLTINGSDTFHAFGWSQGSGYIDLNTRISEPTFIFSRAYGISNNGTIVGYGIKAGVKVACILTPIN